MPQPRVADKKIVYSVRLRKSLIARLKKLALDNNCTVVSIIEKSLEGHVDILENNKIKN